VGVKKLPAGSCHLSAFSRPIVWRSRWSVVDEERVSLCTAKSNMDLAKLIGAKDTAQNEYFLNHSTFFRASR
jgi:hypothetical protein